MFFGLFFFSFYSADIPFLCMRQNENTGIWPAEDRQTSQKNLT